MDYVKIKVLNTSTHTIESSPLLNFEAHINEETGKQCTCRHAFYNGLTFMLIEQNDKNSNCNIIIEGSLGVYWNHIKHNFNNIESRDIDEIIRDLKEKFNIDKKNCVLEKQIIYFQIDSGKIHSKILCKLDINKLI